MYKMFVVTLVLLAIVIVGSLSQVENLFYSSIDQYFAGSGGRSSGGGGGASW
ncbi:MAG: hypothetical protein JXR70_14720 [Spirochaetales bacterium]|nr:hypothetical protein [Spirochaetales bacterium]